MVLMMGGVYTPRLRENQKEEEKKKLGKNDSINRAAESAGSEVVGPPLSWASEHRSHGHQTAAATHWNKLGRRIAWRRTKIPYEPRPNFFFYIHKQTHSTFFCLHVVLHVRLLLFLIPFYLSSSSSPFAAAFLFRHLSTICPSCNIRYRGDKTAGGGGRLLGGPLFLKRVFAVTAAVRKPADWKRDKLWNVLHNMRHRLHGGGANHSTPTHTQGDVFAYAVPTLHISETSSHDWWPAAGRD